VEPEKFITAAAKKEKAISRAGDTWPPLEEVELNTEEEMHKVF
jgi:hypothetical protein